MADSEEQDGTKEQSEDILFKPDQEEIESYRRMRRRSSHRAIGKGWALLFNAFLTLALIAGLGAGGWIYWQQYQSVLVQIPSIKEKLDTLEVATENNDYFTKELTRIDKQLEQVGAEVGEIRDISNKRNQQWIKTNAAALEVQKKDIGELFEITKVLKARTEDFDRALSIQQDLQERTTTAAISIEQLEEAEKQITGAVNKLIDQQGETEKIVTSVDESIKSIDRNRKLLNRKMLNLEKDVFELRKQLKASGSASGSASSGSTLEPPPL